VLGSNDKSTAACNCAGLSPLDRCPVNTLTIDAGETTFSLSEIEKASDSPTFELDNLVRGRARPQPTNAKK
jgi:hypothetical protein